MTSSRYFIRHVLRPYGWLVIDSHDISDDLSKHEAIASYRSEIEAQHRADELNLKGQS